MFSRHLPDPVRASHSSPAPKTTVYHARTSEEYHHPIHSTPYLLISNFGSSGDYKLNGEPVHANNQLFYFANSGDELEICFREQRSRETLLILFDSDTVHEAAEAWERSPEYLLEHPFAESRKPISIPSVPFAYTAGFRHALQNVCNNEGQYHNQVLTQFISLYSDACQMMRRVPAKKAVTRQEIYRRLTVARAFMDANLDANLTLEQIAREAFLNRFYFLTTFKAAFGVTPHEYLRRQKLHRSFHLLRQRYSVTEACQSVGYSSLGSFTNVFKKTFGCVPSSVAKGKTIEVDR